MQKVVDARGLTSPGPVVVTRQALEQMERGIVTTVVNSSTALENVTQMAHKLGCEVEVEERAGDYYIHIEKPQMSPTPGLMGVEQVVLMLSSDVMGQGNEVLGRNLLRNFLYTFCQMKSVASTIVLYNSAVFLAVEGSETLGYLLELERAGIRVLCCRTSVELYRLRDKLMVGELANMYTIVEAIAAAPKVITL
ncbi:MAG: sulfurtransferase-like selenium metabolism protein YedF [Syntrophomonadaceae bacterium]|nr:sulfurtransferase-like selenium metabolism protein YedF [Syntrophomonadaceae bacterium]